MNDRSRANLGEDNRLKSVQWHKILTWTRSHPNWRLAELALVIDYMLTKQELERYYPYTSHFTLCLSPKPSAPYAGLPRIEALGNGQFRVFAGTLANGELPSSPGEQYAVLGEGSASGATELVLNALRGMESYSAL